MNQTYTPELFPENEHENIAQGRIAESTREDLNADPKKLQDLKDHVAVVPNLPENTKKVELQKEGKLAGATGVLLIRTDATRDEILKVLEGELLRDDESGEEPRLAAK